MYEELVIALRTCVDKDKGCSECPYYTKNKCIYNTSGKHPAMVDAADAIEKLSKPRWIPVTERLPEEFQPVWVACKMDGRENWTFDTIYDPYLKCPWGTYYYLEKGEAVVYAWMDRSDPEPPKEEA